MTETSSSRQVFPDQWPDRLPYLVNRGVFLAGLIAAVLTGSLGFLFHASAQDTATTKVAFLKDREVVVSGIDGTNPLVLTHDQVRKGDLRWSPDGTRLFYVTDPSDSGSLVNLVIIASDTGKQIARFPVRKMDEDEVAILNNMRFVEDAGWVSNSEIYITGSESPHDGSLESFDSRTGRVLRRLDGFSFSVCSKLGSIAYVDGDDSTPEVTVRIDDKAVLQQDNKLHLGNLTWNSSCDRLALLEFDRGDIQKPVLLILRGDAVESKIPLSSELSDATIRPENGTFVVITPRGHYVAYDPTSHQVVAPSALFDSLISNDRTNDVALQRLGANGSVDFSHPSVRRMQ